MNKIYGLDRKGHGSKVNKKVIEE